MLRSKSNSRASLVRALIRIRCRAVLCLTDNSCGLFDLHWFLDRKTAYSLSHENLEWMEWFCKRKGKLLQRFRPLLVPVIFDVKSAIQECKETKPKPYDETWVCTYIITRPETIWYNKYIQSIYRKAVYASWLTHKIHSVRFHSTQSHSPHILMQSPLLIPQWINTEAHFSNILPFYLIVVPLICFHTHWHRHPLVSFVIFNW